MKRFSLLTLAALILISLLGDARPATAGNMEPEVSHGPYLELATDNSWKWSPSVAYSTLHDDYFVVWETILPGGHHAIYGRRVSPSGTLYPTLTIYDGVYDSLQPAVAYDPIHDRYLVVWSYDYDGDGSDHDIYGRFIPWDGSNPSAPSFVFDSSRANSGKPRLAYSSSPDLFMIVWVDYQVDDNPICISGGILLGDGTALPMTVSCGPELRDFPDIAYNSNNPEFVVVWDEDVGRDGDSDLDIHGIRLNFAGTPISPGEFAPASLPQHEEHPTVAFCPTANEYMIAWQQQVNETSPDSNIFGRILTTTGILQQSYGIAGTTLPQRYPRLSCNSSSGNEFLMVWHDQYAQPYPRWGVWGALYHPDLRAETYFEIVRPSEYRDRLYPAVAYGKYHALVVWQHARDDSGYLDIWAQVIYPYRIFVPAVTK